MKAPSFPGNDYWVDPQAMPAWSFHITIVIVSVRYKRENDNKNLLQKERNVSCYSLSPWSVMAGLQKWHVLCKISWWFLCYETNSSAYNWPIGWLTGNYLDVFLFYMLWTHGHKTELLPDCFCYLLVIILIKAHILQWLSMIIFTGYWLLNCHVNDYL